jgi:hypothetical protein
MRALDVTQIRRSPKSTIVGLCIFALAAERGVRFDASGHLAMSAKDWFEVGCGALSAVISALSQDATPCTEAAAQKHADEAPGSET